MAGISSSDLVVIVLGLVLATLYLFKDTLFAAKGKDTSIAGGKFSGSGQGGTAGDSAVDSRDFVAKLKATKKRIAIFYGSQTGTAEDYAIRLAKEAKSKFGLGSLVCDAEEYDFENLDQVPSDCAVFFVMATYGEGEPTDNAVTLLANLREEEFSFSNGAHELPGLKYVVFGLGNRTYEHYNVIGRQVDEALTKAGGVRIGERGEGDDDKSMEEDYLAWKDGMWDEFSRVMGVEEGAGADTADFVVHDLSAVEQNKVYLGELSARALNKTKGIHDQKNPYAAPLSSIRELFQSTHERNCVHVELNIEGSGITYQHGDHVGIWPSNPDVEVDRLLLALGLYEKKDQVISIESLDPALAKVPFPVPTTYGTVLRHYIDISAVAGRQALNAFSHYAPTLEAGERLSKLGSDKEAYSLQVARPCLKLGEVLMLAAGDAPLAPGQLPSPGESKISAWPIPFDVIVSAIPRLQPRFYSISSSPKMHPQSIHVTCVVLKYKNDPYGDAHAKWVFGLGSNYLLNLKVASDPNSSSPIHVGNGSAEVAKVSDQGVEGVVNPTYNLAGPRGAYASAEEDSVPMYKAPVHVRRSTFRLPTNPKSPILMIGPGTGVAPFRGFVQERVALARKALEKNGPDALAQWGDIRLYYGCRSDTEDFLYASEWPGYIDELKGKFAMRTAFSRSGPRKPDGSKIYVQDLLWEDRALIKEMVWEKKGYVYICGDAKSMSKSVEEVLARILGEAKGGDLAVGQAEVKNMKERSRILLDVWS